MTLATGDEKHGSSTISTLPIIWTLYDRILRYDPQQPHSPNRDRFVLSKGHGPVGYYAVLADKGFFRRMSCAASWGGWHSGRAPGPQPGTGCRGIDGFAWSRPPDGGWHGAGAAYQSE